MVRVYCAGVAQMVEQRIRNAKVEGSIPFTGTIHARMESAVSIRAPLTGPARWGAIFLLLALFISPLGDAMAVEEPKYEVISAEGPFEHRRYAGYLIAETELSGDFDVASRTGFRRVAGYIFGDNQAPSGESRKIAMTAPVTVEPKRDGWRLHFVMPSEESLETLPKPNNPNVKIRRVPEHQMASVRFSGWTTESAVQEQTEKLRAWMKTSGLVEGGAPQVARYNDPFTLPWRRRNEILIPLKPAP